MIDPLATFLGEVKRDRTLPALSEAALKQKVITRMLHLLGWDIFNIEEVVPEYSVQGGRVDYSLRLRSENKVFLEVKRAGDELGKHEEQLLEYSFRMGADLAALTTGVTWWFYLPTKRGDWRKRKFYAIDLAEQEPTEAASKFLDLLSKQSVLTGQALETAEEIYTSEQKKKAIEEAIPEAWEKIVSEPDSLLVELLAETAERLCGYRPEEAEVIRFLKGHQSTLTPYPTIAKSEQEKEVPRRPQAQRVSATPVMAGNVGRITQRQLIPHILEVLRQHGGRARKEEVENELYARFRSVFDGDPWYEEAVSHGVPRWKHNIAWAKEEAKRRGLIAAPKNSGRGFWQLTPEGRANQA